MNRRQTARILLFASILVLVISALLVLILYPPADHVDIVILAYVVVGVSLVGMSVGIGGVLSGSRRSLLQDLGAGGAVAVLISLILLWLYDEAVLDRFLVTYSYIAFFSGAIVHRVLTELLMFTEPPTGSE